MGLSAAFEVHRYPPSMFDEPQNEVAIPGSRRSPSTGAHWRDPLARTRRMRPDDLPFSLRRRHAIELGRLPLEQPAIDSPGPGGERGMGSLLDDLAAIEPQDPVEAAYRRQPV